MPHVRTYLCALSLALTSFLCASAAGQGAGSTAGAPPAKIGVVSIQEAIFATNEGQKEAEALQQRFSPKQSSLKAQNDEIEKLNAQLQAQGDKLSEEERAKRVKEMTEKRKTLQRSIEDSQAEFQQAEQEIMNRLGQKMYTLMEKYAVKNGYTVILDVSNQQTTPVLWANPDNVISKGLVDAYNAENPVSRAPATKPAASAPKPAATTPKPAAPATTPKKP